MRKKQALPGNNSFLCFLVSQTQLVKERFSAGLRNFIHICFKKKLHENFAPPETTRQADAGAVGQLLLLLPLSLLLFLLSIAPSLPLRLSPLLALLSPTLGLSAKSMSCGRRRGDGTRLSNRVTSRSSSLTLRTSAAPFLFLRTRFFACPLSIPLQTVILSQRVHLCRTSMA